MENWQLPAELEELERALAGRPLPTPSAQLRERVLGDVRRATRKGTVPFSPTRKLGQSPAQQSRWRFAVAVAATVLVWLNLSLSATRTTDCGLRPRGSGPSIETACRQIEQLVPELSPKESRRQAILLCAGSALVPCPDLSSSIDVANLARSFLWEERREERSN